MSSEEAHEAEEAHALYVRTILMLTLMVCSIMIIHALKMKGFHAIGETTLYVLIGSKIHSFQISESMKRVLMSFRSCRWICV
jgi:hypothetical protein